MPELRWILTFLGLVLLIGIYVWGRRSSASSSAKSENAPRPRPEPAFEAVDDYDPPLVEVSDDAFEPESDALVAAAEPASARSLARATLDESNEPTIEVHTSRTQRDARSRVEPTFNEESVTAELPVREFEPTAQTRAAATTSMDAPTLSMSSTPSPRRIERRKIIALRLAMPQRVPGAQLKAALENESLQHGRYDVFHRLDDEGVAMFSVASMVEPGTFDVEKMPQESYPGITLFAQLPGPVAGMLAFNELVACSKRLHSELGGTLQDERGVPLTVHRIERIRQEIREFEHRPSADAAARPTPTISPSS